MRKINRHVLISLTALITVSILTAGCEPLRKKFRRKKKAAKKEQFIPVLDPIDYPPARVSSIEKYKYHYSLWQVWSKDLRHLVDEETMDKRKKYLLSQIMQQLVEMKKWTPSEHIAKVDEALSEYEKVQKELSKPEIMRSPVMLQSRLRRTENFIRNELNPNLVLDEPEEE